MSGKTDHCSVPSVYMTSAQLLTETQQAVPDTQRHNSPHSDTRCGHSHGARTLQVHQGEASREVFTTYRAACRCVDVLKAERD